MRGVLAVVATTGLVILSVLSTHGEAEKWLGYEPATVRLEGVVEPRERFGPPNYGENPETDSKVIVAILHLRTPVNVRGSPASVVNRETEEHVTEIHMILPKGYDPMKLIGQTVVVTGSLFHAITAHHATSIVMVVRAVESPSSAK